ncbi:MAG TPA: spermidine synthase [Actinophytocola sp.]|uniref:spermidine synthase n=1 Tax=Actinophytocola sp. TaxID=1872138 RepID=UPI002DDD4DCE|nr:spermidine synthase [Actinophytocola sp.]HEV2781006.1 spermidine synthase [Actinophytocola sp.]
MSRIVEPLAPGLSRVWELSEILVDTRTRYQHVVIARTAQGVTLFCDDDRQSTEAGQLVYHEALLVPALLLARRLDRVLVIGSSEGVVSQLALAAGARHVDHVDIDRQAVELCARHLPYGYSPADLAGDGPVRLHYADGWDFVTRTRDRYDIVVIDVPDEHPGPAQHNRLYGTEFLRRCRSVLTDGGVVAAQAGCPALWRDHTLIRSWRRFHQVFDTVTYFGSDEHEWAFLFGLADRLDRSIDHMLERLATLPYRPASIDADTVRGRTIAPHSVRTAMLNPARIPAGSQDRRPGRAG